MNNNNKSHKHDFFSDYIKQSKTFQMENFKNHFHIQVMIIIAKIQAQYLRIE